MSRAEKIVLWVCFLCCLIGNKASLASLEGVPSLNEESFDDYLVRYETVFVKFYAPWCGHCKNLAPHFKRIHDFYKDSIAVAAVDATQHKDLANRFSIEAYPTLILFHQLKAYDYNQDYSFEGMRSFLNRYLPKHPPTFPALTPQNLTAFITKQTTSIVAFFLDTEQQGSQFQRWQLFQRTSETRFTTATVSLSNEDLSQLSDYVSSTPSVVFFNTEEETIQHYKFTETIFSVTQLLKWATNVENKLSPASDILEFSRRNYMQGLKEDLPFLILWIDPQNRQMKNKAIELLSTIYSGTPKSAVYFWGNGVAWKDQILGHYWKDREDPDATSINFPALTILLSPKKGDNPSPTTWELTDTMLNLETLKGFVELIEAKKRRDQAAQKPQPQAEPEESESQDSLVQILSTASFEKVVFDSNSDVLVKFYAPWCGHCKRMAPTYDKLSNRVEELKSAHRCNLVIAKMDVTSQPIPPSAVARVKKGLHIQGVPTVLFFGAKNKANPISYEGDRSLDDLLNFVQQHCTTQGKDEL